MMQLVDLHVREVFFFFFSKEYEDKSDEGGVCIYKGILGK